jgi:hypothetical protein
MKMKTKVKEAGFGKQFKVEGFREAYHSLQHKQMPEARDEICRLCYWSTSKFRSMVMGKMPFRVYEIEQIEKYFATHNLNAWTGENLN